MEQPNQHEQAPELLNEHVIPSSNEMPSQGTPSTELHSLDKTLPKHLDKIESDHSCESRPFSSIADMMRMWARPDWCDYLESIRQSEHLRIQNLKIQNPRVHASSIPSAQIDSVSQSIQKDSLNQSTKQAWKLQQQVNKKNNKK